MNTNEPRRLLEMAAKAVGYMARTDLPYSDGIIINDGVLWNPADDDGDSRRLEVSLKIHHRRYSSPAKIRGCRCDGGYIEAARKDIEEREPINGDPCAAVRLAVLRVAAAVGESLP